MSMFGGSNNPVLNESAFQPTFWDAQQRDYDRSKTMTVQGAATVTMILLGIVGATATVMWSYLAQSAWLWPATFGGSILGCVLTWIVCYKKNWSPFLAFPIAISEGAVVGGMSVLWTQYVGHKVAVGSTGVVSTLSGGLVMQAVLLTVAVAAGMLLLNMFNILRATPIFTKIILSAISGVFFFTMIAIVLAMFGVNLHIFENGPIGIGFSLLVVAVAAFTLVLDFDRIRAGSEYRLPKYMEWYSAIGLLVTLVWLYTSILRLLAMLNRRD
jgi:uncharacterized YccA/Bax inhibitor family protein